MSYYYLDLRYGFLFLINVVKPAGVVSWDPFGVLTNNNPNNWTKFSLLFLLFLLFSFISITISSPLRISVRFNNFSAMNVVSLVASLLLPRLYFWYLYPFLIIALSSSSSCRNCISKLFHNFVTSSLQPIDHNVVSSTPGFDIHITIASNDDDDDDDD